MTNAEKYLKENVYIEDILSDFSNMYADNELQKSVLILGLKKFFEAPAKKEETKPTLTEDEKVILRNIGEDCISLMRVDGAIFFHTEGKGIFPNLFKFIKERRRI